MPTQVFGRLDDLFSSLINEGAHHNAQAIAAYIVACTLFMFKIDFLPIDVDRSTLWITNLVSFYYFMSVHSKVTTNITQQNSNLCLCIVFTAPATNQPHTKPTKFELLHCKEKGVTP